VTDVETYRAKALDLRAQARASATAAEAAPFIELAVAWEKLADEADAGRGDVEAAGG
jgi:hypothetical protein